MGIVICGGGPVWMVSSAWMITAGVFGSSLGVFDVGMLCGWVDEYVAFDRPSEPVRIGEDDVGGVGNAPSAALSASKSTTPAPWVESSSWLLNAAPNTRGIEFGEPDEIVSP